MSAELVDLAKARDWHGYFQALRDARAPKVTKADLELPPPERTSRDPWPEGFKAPQGAQGLLKLAEGAGWAARLQYARGWVWGVGTRQNLVHTVALVAAHPSGRRAFVVYEAKVADKLSWTAKSILIWGQGLPPYGGLGVEDLKAYLTSGGQVTQGWLEEIRAKKAAQAATQKERAKAAPKKKREAA